MASACMSEVASASMTTPLWMAVESGVDECHNMSATLSTHGTVRNRSSRQCQPTNTRQHACAAALHPCQVSHAHITLPSSSRRRQRRSPSSLMPGAMSAAKTHSCGMSRAMDPAGSPGPLAASSTFSWT